MSVEQEILLAVLKLTKDGPIKYSLIGKNARTPAQIAESFLRKLEDSSLIRWKEKIIEASPRQRVRIAVQAVELGADFERVCRLLEWKEFESFTTTSFEAYGYYVLKNFRFKGENGKRWEIDILACKQPLIASVDCKHWKRKWTRSPIMKIVDQHMERTISFTNILPNIYSKIKLVKWKHATIIPIILSLLPSPFKFHHDTPIVSVLQLQNFLNELPAHMNILTHYTQKLTKINRKITEYSQYSI